PGFVPAADFDHDGVIGFPDLQAWFAAQANQPAPIVVTTTLDWSIVGNPGNACDPQGQSCFGAVLYPYSTSTTEVTNAQYAAFLNAVAAADPHGLYDAGMGDTAVDGGIKRTGNSGSYVYSPIAGREHRPVNFVTFYDGLRFANWLHNGEPSGPQDALT